MSRPTYQRAQSPSPDMPPSRKPNIRYFGDTDQESIHPNISKGATLNNSHSKRVPSNANSSRNVRNAASMQQLNKVSFFEILFFLSWEYIRPFRQTENSI